VVPVATVEATRGWSSLDAEERRARGHGDAEAEYRNVLVAFDGSPHAERALATAIERVRRSHGRLTVLTAADPVPSVACFGAAASGVGELARALTCEAERTLRRAVEAVPADVSVTGILTTDPIRRALPRRIASDAYDLLVIGAPRRRGLRALLHGSATRTALRRCPIPVLTVGTASREPARAEPLDEAPMPNLDRLRHA
jgi:nucleotide-binding universal stress UspA family protein